VITTPAFEELARGSWVVHHSPETLQGLSEWHQTNFKRVEEGGNGLLAAVQASALGKEEVEQAVLAMLREHGSEKCTRLAGNSVHCDREVLRATMPGVYAFVSHQVMDVSTVVNLTRMWMPTLGAQIPPALGYDHRASNDIDASIAMMQWFKDHLFRE
jgi:oligoribonuclease